MMPFREAKLKPWNFVIDPTKEPEQQTPDEMANVMRELAARSKAADGPQVIRGEKL